MSAATLTPAALDILARAEKRMVGHFERRGIDAELISICSTYERMLAVEQSGAPSADEVTTGVVDDLLAVVVATYEPPVASSSMAGLASLRFGSAVAW